MSSSSIIPLICAHVSCIQIKQPLPPHGYQSSSSLSSSGVLYSLPQQPHGVWSSTAAAILIALLVDFVLVLDLAFLGAFCILSFNIADFLGLQAVASFTVSRRCFCLGPISEDFDVGRRERLDSLRSFCQNTVATPK